jgi:hypothetical protein
MNANAALSFYYVKRPEVLPRNRHMEEAAVTCGMEAERWNAVVFTAFS